MCLGHRSALAWGLRKLVAARKTRLRVGLGFATCRSIVDAAAFGRARPEAAMCLRLRRERRCRFLAERNADLRAHRIFGPQISWRGSAFTQRGGAQRPGQRLARDRRRRFWHCRRDGSLCGRGNHPRGERYRSGERQSLHEGSPRPCSDVLHRAQACARGPRDGVGRFAFSASARADFLAALKGVLTFGGTNEIDASREMLCERIRRTRAGLSDWVAGSQTMRPDNAVTATAPRHSSAKTQFGAASYSPLRCG